METPPRTEPSRAALRLLATLAIAAGGCASLPADPGIPAVIATITPESARGEVEALLALGLRPAADPEASRRTIDHLRARLEGWGYAIREESFSASVPAYSPSEGGGWRIESVDTVQTNLLAERPGRTLPGEVVEVCAHYDTLFDSPGADDNTSGVAGAIEIARALAAVELDRTVRFCFFAAEEHGLLGSRHHVERIRAGDEGEIVGLLNLEMIGYTDRAPGSQRTPGGFGWLIGTPDRGNFIAVIGTARSSSLGTMVVEAMRTYVPELPVFGLPSKGSWFPDSHRSDHAPYWLAKLPAVMLTDTAEFRNPHYHERSDTIDTLDFGFLAAVARGAAAAVIHRARIGTER